MYLIRVPYPEEAEDRRSVFERVCKLLARFGAIEGSTEAGTFWGVTPIGKFAGSYRSPEGMGELEIELREKPWLISVNRIESEARKFLAAS